MLTFDYPADRSGVATAAPAAFTEADIDRDAIREVFARIFAAIAPTWLWELRARDLLFAVDGPDRGGWLSVTVTRAATGELLATTNWHWSAAVRPDWTPPSQPATVDRLW